MRLGAPGAIGGVREKIRLTREMSEWRDDERRMAEPPNEDSS